jgi:serine/threonine-protein kinase
VAEEPEIAGREDVGVELAPGTVISQTKQYQIVQRLGEGGMGKVYKVFDPIMNRYAALKMIKVDVPDDYKRRFRQEARLCGTFMHPNLCRTLEVGTTKEHGLFWFAMEYLEGRDLSQLMASGKVPSLRPLQEVFKQTLDALTHVHARRFVHCDIKPANIFIATDLYDPGLKLVKLLDFGIARDLSDPNPPDQKRIYGDPYYMPPEQTWPGGPVDARSDLYALGMTFFELVTGGRHPFEDLAKSHPRELLRAQRERVPTSPSAYLPPDTPRNRAEDIDSVFLTACAKNPEERFQNAKAMQRALMMIDPG